MRFLSGSRVGRWVVWVACRALGRPLSVPHAAGWMMIPEHSVEQVLDDGVLPSLYPQDVLRTARTMQRQRREHDERHAASEREGSESSGSESSGSESSGSESSGSESSARE